jgi:hypothetical protein
MGRPEIDLIKVLTSLGVPGVAIGIFYLLLRRFNWVFPRVPRSWVGPIIVIYMLLSSIIVFYALTIFSDGRSRNQAIDDEKTNNGRGDVINVIGPGAIGGKAGRDFIVNQNTETVKKNEDEEE